MTIKLLRHLSSFQNNGLPILVNIREIRTVLGTSASELFCYLFASEDLEI